MKKQSKGKKGQEQKETPGERKTMNGMNSFSNKYELAIIAAKEARRLNDICRRTGEEHKERVTLFAVDKALKGKIRHTYEAPEGKTE
jgi:DNA-directed RNA polymerase subunit K/omega